MLTHGYRVKEISQQLHISERTVTTHQEKIYQKLNIHHRASLIQFSPYYSEFLEILSPRERTIIHCLSQDFCSADICIELNLSIETIYSYRKTIKRKFKNIQAKYDILGVFDHEEILLD